ncbi:hypothetical protein MPSEU_000690000 [Mayamaea pseudoterrestris]|nr:hypothetical protein MPSEU_000690000 [Mayamaea pseudoterrestris]
MSFVYRPTPVEEAYALYLLRTVFHRDYYAVDFELSGRQAVPFLTLSGQDRLILRHVWSAVDPHNVGTLTDLSQFHASLRLIALAQCGVLGEALASAFRRHAGNVAPVDVMTACLQATAMNDRVPLPVFAGISMPSGSTLQLIYQEGQRGRGEHAPEQSYGSSGENYSQMFRSYQTNQVDMEDSSERTAHTSNLTKTIHEGEHAVFENIQGTGNVASTSSGLDSFVPQAETFPSVVPAFVSNESSTAAAIDPFAQQQHGLIATAPQTTATLQQTDDDDFGDFTSTSAEPSGWDALDALAGVQDAPLPQLPSFERGLAVVGRDNDKLETIVAAAEQQGNNVIAPTLSFEMSSDISQQVPPTNTQSGSAIFAVDDAFMSFDNVASALQPTISNSSMDEQLQQPAINSTDVDDDDFGDFAAHGEAVEDFAVEDSFGIHPESTVQAAPELTGWDALDALADVSLQVNASFTSNGNDESVEALATTSSMDEADWPLESTVNEQIVQDDDNSASDDFGDFVEHGAEALEHTISSQEATLTMTSASGWDALGALATDTSVLSIHANQSFDSAMNVKSVGSSLSNADEREGAGGHALADSPTGATFAADLTSTSDSSVNIKAGGAVGSSEVNQPSVEELFGQTLDYMNVDSGQAIEFASPGAIERTASMPDNLTHPVGIQMETVKHGSLERASSVPTTTGGWDAFDALAPIQDAPLLSLDSMTETTNQAEPDASFLMSSDQDEFGEFEAVHDIQVTDTSDRKDSEYYSAASTTNSNDLEGFESATETEQDNASVDPSQTHVEVVGSDNAEVPSIVNDDPFSVFDALAPADVSLPPLTAASTQSVPTTSTGMLDVGGKATLVDDDEDDFGDFVHQSNDDELGIHQSSQESVDEHLVKRDAVIVTSNAIAVTNMLDVDGNMEALVVDDDEDDFGDFVDHANDDELGIHPSLQEFDDVNLLKRDAVIGTSNAIAFEEDDSFGDFDSHLATETILIDDERPAEPQLGAPVADTHTAINADLFPQHIDPLPSDPVFDAAFDGFEHETGLGGEEFISSNDNPASGDLSSAPIVDSDDFDASFGDFADFQAAPAAADTDLIAGSPADDGHIDLRAQFISLSLQLPGAFLHKASGSDQVNFADCFDANIGTDQRLSSEQLSRIKRALHLMEMLATTHTKLTSTYWDQALSVIHDELLVATTLLDEAKAMPSSDLALVASKLEVFVHGLGEYVRIARLIAATIGDLLLLDPTALLTSDTLETSWCSVSLLKKVLDIEQMWSNIERVANNLCLASKQNCNHRLASIVEMRTPVTNQDTRLCQFTLQPLTDDANTLSTVAWGGRDYVACAANFLCHRCPFYAAEV